MKAKRARFDDYARQTAMFTLPWLDPELEKSGVDPTSMIGTQCVRSIASSLMKGMFPPGVKSAELDLTPAQWAGIQSHPQGGEEAVNIIKARLGERDEDVQRSVTMKTSRSRMAAALRRNVIEGTTGIIVLPDSIRVYPLRSLVVEREAGVVRIAMFCDKYEADPMAEGEGPDSAYDILTLVDFEKHEVWKQVKDQDPQRIDEVGKPAFEFTDEQVLIVTGEIPDCEDYAPGYAYHYMRAFRQVNHSERSLGEAQAAAAWNRPRVKPGSAVSMDIRAFFEAPAGTPFLGEEDDVDWLTNTGKLGDWEFVGGLVERKNRELATAFAMGIKDRPASDSTTATEVLTIIDELNTQTHDLIGTYEETLSIPLYRAELAILERISPMIPEALEISAAVRQMVRIVVTTGSNAIEKQRAMDKFVNVHLPVVMKLDPTVRANGLPILKRVSSYQRLETDGLYRAASPAEIQAMIAAANPQGQQGQAENQPRQETMMTAGGPQISQQGLQPGSP